MRDGIIEESQSPWRAQVLITRNANHKKRLVIDYSQTVNRYPQLDAYPQSNIEDMVTKVSKYSTFSTYRVVVTKCRFFLKRKNTPHLKLPVTFLLALQTACLPLGNTVIRKKELSGTFAYLDDITICGKSQEDHDTNLEKFMNVAKVYGLTLNKEKSKFNLKLINILRYLIFNHVIKPDSSRLQPLLDLLPPNDLASLRRTLGMFAHCTKWIPNFSERVHDLAHCQHFRLTTQALESFENLKSMVAKSSVNAIDNNIAFTVETDASEHSNAAILSKIQDQKHLAIEKEAYAIVESLEMEALSNRKIIQVDNRSDICEFHVQL